MAFGVFFFILTIGQHCCHYRPQNYLPSVWIERCDNHFSFILRTLGLQMLNPKPPVLTEVPMITVLPSRLVLVHDWHILHPVHYPNVLYYITWVMLIKIQPDATVCRYLFTARLLYMFRVLQHPSSGVLKTVTAASGTGHNTGAATSLQRDPIGPRWREVAAPVLWPVQEAAGYSF